MVRNGTFRPKLPCIASHEASGTIVSVGSAAVTNFSPGDRVMCGIPYRPCTSCRECRGSENQTQYCEGIEKHAGVLGDGYYAEYAVADARTSTKLPDKVTFEAAAPLACAGRTIWRGVDQTGLKAGEWIALVGSGGGLGHFGLQFAKAKGLNVVGIDARDGGLEVTREYGADVVLDAREGKEKLVEAVKKVTGGQGVDASVVISDHQDASAISCAITKMHGEVIQIAQPENIIIPFHEFVFRDIRIRGSLLCSRQESVRMLDDVATHNIKTKTHVFHGLDKINELTSLVEGGKLQGKAIIIVDEEQIKKEKELGATV